MTPEASTSSATPAGAIDAVWWRRDGVTLVGNVLPAAIDRVLPDDLAIDWPRLGEILKTPALLTDRGAAVRRDDHPRRTMG
jgi:hypothetical protein